MMKKYINTILCVGACLCAAAAIYMFMHKHAAIVEVPSLSLRGGKANTSSEFLNAQKAVDYYRQEIQQHPDRAKNYIELAQLFLQEARVTGRHHEYIPKARYLIEQVLEREPQNYDAMVTKASMLMTMHQFADAKTIVERSIEQQPHSAAAFGILCDAQVELGNYAEAVTACDKMLSVRPDLRSYARASYLRELHGDVNGAIEAMKLAADAGMTGQENRAWALYNLGKLFFNEGKIDTAAYLFNGILEERPDYAFALSGLAQVKRALGKTQEAVNLLSKAAQITPEHVFVEQLADVYRSAGQIEQADGVAKIVLQMFEQHEKGGWNINREYAMFCVNHNMNLEEALQRAKKEYAIRPNNIDVLETYAWTLYKNGRAYEAVPLIELAMKMNTKSFSLAYHAGKIYAAAGMKDKAQVYFDIAKNENGFVNLLVLDDDNSATSLKRTTASLQ